MYHGRPMIQLAGYGDGIEIQHIWHTRQPAIQFLTRIRMEPCTERSVAVS